MQKQGALRKKSKATMFQTVSRGAAAPTKTKYADVAELADALDSGSSESNFIWVQVPSSAPKKNRNSDTKELWFLFFYGIMKLLKKS